MKKLIREWFELWCRKRWMKTIYRSISKMNRRVNQWEHERYVVHRLVNRYNELYPNSRLKLTKQIQSEERSGDD